MRSLDSASKRWVQGFGFLDCSVVAVLPFGVWFRGFGWSGLGFRDLGLQDLGVGFWRVLWVSGLGPWGALGIWG